MGSSSRAEQTALSGHEPDRVGYETILTIQKGEHGIVLIGVIYKKNPDTSSGRILWFLRFAQELFLISLWMFPIERRVTSTDINYGAT